MNGTPSREPDDRALAGHTRKGAYRAIHAWPVAAGGLEVAAAGSSETGSRRAFLCVSGARGVCSRARKTARPRRARNAPVQGRGWVRFGALASSFRVPPAAPPLPARLLPPPASRSRSTIATILLPQGRNSIDCVRWREDERMGGRLPARGSIPRRVAGRAGVAGVGVARA